ncbi:colorectal mutant cancer protein-like [Lytechinus variegatus]|uniref:colorectal mutant cancer protein-like n=1 Tax=Lytechinus variegatus TaxID=7654 RepID=UPI001BB29EE6|nr:colorectal mutant cancer protein-like [Lytechinus variegatus]
MNMQGMNRMDGRSSHMPPNELHLAALASLKGEIIELSNRLQKVTSERDSFEKRLTKAQLERARYLQDNDDKLDQQAVRYEERITELHSVIAELNKKIDRSHGNTIQEEEEFSHSASSPPSNMSNSGGSCNGSSCHDSDSAANIDSCNDLGAELSRVVGELECAMEGRKVGDVFRKHIESAEHEVEKLAEASEDIKQRTLQAVQEVESLDLDSIEAQSPQSHRTTPNGHFNHHQLHLETRRRSSLEQEVTLLREENETLNSSLSMKEEEMHKLKASFMGIRDERDKLRKKVRELQSILHANNQKLGGYTSSSSAEQLNSPNPRHSPRNSPGPSPSQSAHNVNPSTGELSLTGSDRRTDIPVAKVAERVRLKPSRSASSSSKSSSDRCVLGSDISNIGITNPKVAEHLAQTLQSCSSMQEILQTLSSYGLSIPEHKAREIEVDLERLTSKIEHLRCQNDVLQLSLEESKSNADRLTMLVGKYESNNTALQLAVNYSEQTIEALEVVFALKESEQSVLLANCKAAGVGLESSEGSGEDSEETTSMLKRVHDNRKVSENVAKALLQRLDRSCGTMVCHVPLQPWEDLSSHSHTSTTSSTASSCDTEFSREDEQRLRDYIQQLKNDRAAVRLTVMELESVHVDPMSQESTPSGDSQRLDLENAVLMQELTALKEEKAELKAQYYLLDKEKKTLELKLSSREAQEQAYRVQIDHLKSEVKDSLSSPWEEQSSSLGRHRIDVMMRNGKVETDHHSRQGSTSSSGGGPGGGGGSGGTTPAITLAELSMLEDPSLQVNAAEMLRREKRLKARIQELVMTLEKLQKNSEMRHQQSAEFVADLKRANSALVTAYEKAKKKHQSRLKKLEAQMMAMVERHDTQVRMLKQRIALLEEENHASRPPHNETSL